MIKNLSIVLLSLISVAWQSDQLAAQTQASAATQNSELSAKQLESLQNAEETFGWKTAEEDGKFEFIVQIAPKSFAPEKLIRLSNGEMTTQRQAFLLSVPRAVQGRIQRVVVRIGQKPLQREALEDRPMPPLDPKSAAETSGDETIPFASPADGKFAYLFDASGGQHQGVIGVSPEMLSFMHSSDKEFVSNLKPSIAKTLTQLVIVVGVGPLPTSLIKPAPSASSLSNANTEADSTSETVESLQRKCEELDQRTRQLAAKLRTGGEAAATQKSELEKAVREAFAASQALRRAELARRMQMLQESIDARDRLADEIVHRRMEALLNPILEWQQSQESN